MSNQTETQNTEAQVEAGEATQAEQGAPEAPKKAARVILNPQPKIDAKVDLFAEVPNGKGSVEWKGRLWVVTLDDKVLVMDSREFATFGPEELLLTMALLDDGHRDEVETEEGEAEAEPSTDDADEEETAEA